MKISVFIMFQILARASCQTKMGIGHSTPRPTCRDEEGQTRITAQPRCIRSSNDLREDQEGKCRLARPGAEGGRWVKTAQLLKPPPAGMLQRESNPELRLNIGSPAKGGCVPPVPFQEEWDETGRHEHRLCLCSTSDRVHSAWAEAKAAVATTAGMGS